ncbi:hypothetical protein BJ322DRAFT_662248 [Thelephora terrestris]|uniref:Uncharacterized protein n=1 Tax=Thelephora terrestris TaxID=56493 RepID=A0A9P6L0U3_9AGAM|nr:hypothetical protein BJ322DRAFT_662248 [Thelephora terrestris]
MVTRSWALFMDQLRGTYARVLLTTWNLCSVVHGDVMLALWSFLFPYVIGCLGPNASDVANSYRMLASRSGSSELTTGELSILPCIQEPGPEEYERVFGSLLVRHGLTKPDENASGPQRRKTTAGMDLVERPLLSRCFVDLLP